uniref:NPFR1 n=1 Tax=Pinctada fucata TaxID=50426 RepID=A0AAU8BTY7_PINFU
MANLTTEEWSQLLRVERLPLVLVTSFLFAIGVIGNLAVLVVYKARLKSTQGRYFIPYLAIADLCATTVTASFMLLMDYTEALFPSDQICKVLQFLNWSTSQCSIFLLFVIAVHRYFGVCRPLDMRFTKKWQRAAIVASVVLAYSFGLPLLFFSGRVTLHVNYKGSNVTGDICTFNPGQVKLGEDIYYRILFIGSILMLCIMTALYVPIGKVIFQKFRETKPSSTAKETTSQVTETSQSGLSSASNNATIELQDFVSNDSSSLPADKNSRLNLQSMDLTPSSTLQKMSPAKKKSRKTKSGKSGGHRSKFTLTLMLVVVFYIASYIPFYVIVSTGINDPNVWFNLPPWKLNGSLFLYRCYIINNVVNPIIYGLFDSTFRKHLLGLCSSAVQRIRYVFTPSK